MKSSLIPLSLRTVMLARSKTNRISIQLKQELDNLKQELNTLPQGRLIIKRNRKWVLFYHNLNDQQRSITKNKELIYQLARRQYISLLIELLEEFIDDTSCDLSTPPFSKLMAEIDVLFKRFERGSLDIDRITMTPNQYIWNADRESKKPTRREELIYPTIGRIYMRSKSEQTLGNLLERLHIPYRYEALIRINGINYYPDFIIMLSNDRLIIIEHAGRMDLEKYDESLVARLKAYDSIGLLIGRDVFFSFERDTRDETIAKEVLFQTLVSTPSDNNFLKSVAIRAGCCFN